MRQRPPSVRVASRDPYEVSDMGTAPQWRQVSERLASRLAGNASFAALRDRVLTLDHRSDVIAQLESQGKRDQAAAFLLLMRYHTTFANENQPLYHALQAAARSEFGLSAARRVVPSAQSFADVELGIRAFLRAMYNDTQDNLKSLGISHVTLYRTVTLHSGNTPRGLRFNAGVQRVSLAAKPLTSFSTDARTASFYGDSSRQSMLVRTTLPASRILSTGHTGFGDPADREVIVLGGIERVSAIAKSLAEMPDSTPYTAADLASLQANG